jgi:ribosomal protein S18 acetylase RimI-like enzyme
VHVFIDEDENDARRLRRGYTEAICVRRPWRRQGLAKALIARSLRALREAGMDHAVLSADDDNPNGAVQLYCSMGFRVTKEYTTYRKPMADGG